MIVVYITSVTRVGTYSVFIGYVYELRAMRFNRRNTGKIRVSIAKGKQLQIAFNSEQIWFVFMFWLRCDLLLWY